MQSGIDTVLGVLQAAGFEQLPKPLIVADSAFDFDAAVMGTGVSHDLVVVASVDGPPRRLVRLLSGLSRTLDQVGSRRPVTLILLGESLDGIAVADLGRHARVIPIESPNPPVEEVRQAVAVLVPLALPSATVRGRDPLAQVAEVLGPPLSEEQQAFLDAARVGPDEVKATLRKYIDVATQGEDRGVGS
jgi:hypothetical protein